MKITENDFINLIVANEGRWTAITTRTRPTLRRGTNGRKNPFPKGSIVHTATRVSNPLTSYAKALDKMQPGVKPGMPMNGVFQVDGSAFGTNKQGKKYFRVCNFKTTQSEYTYMGKQVNIETLMPFFPKRDNTRPLFIVIRLDHIVSAKIAGKEYTLVHETEHDPWSERLCPKT